ncbi:MAG: nitrous oxide reductase accessory protein NosL [candidate division WOR-3 bacterium]
MKVNLISRGLLALSSILLISIFFFPLWKIQLIAPQYPEGLTLYIWINKITGKTDFDLYNINLLNHYVGMKPVPSSIPEQKIMPIIGGILIIFGMFSSIFNKRILLYIYSLMLIICAILGLGDFYRWEYEYGHNLDPDAPIKMDPFQPPLIGTKQLLNFTVSSFPHTAGYLAIISVILSFIAIIIDVKLYKKGITSINLIYLLFSVFSCNVKNEPEPIKINEDVCNLCKMVIMDKKFAAQIITKKGKVYKFDSIECMIAYYNKNEKDIEKAYVTNFLNPDEFIDAKNAVYLRAPEIKSPMGMNLSAYKSLDDASKVSKEGEILDFEKLRNLIKKEFHFHH